MNYLSDYNFRKLHKILYLTHINVFFHSTNRKKVTCTWTFVNFAYFSSFHKNVHFQSTFPTFRKHSNSSIFNVIWTLLTFVFFFRIIVRRVARWWDAKMIFIMKGVQKVCDTLVKKFWSLFTFWKKYRTMKKIIKRFLLKS